MEGRFALSAPSLSPVAVGGVTTAADGTPSQRFVKAVIPVGTFIKRHPVTKEKIFELNVTPERQAMWVDAFHAMKRDGIPIRLMDSTKKFTVAYDQKSPLTKNHAGAFMADQSARLTKLAENVVAETDDMFVDPADGWLKTVHDVKGRDAIDFVKRAKFTSPEIDPCLFDGTDKKRGEVITAISIVANPLIPGQTEFQTIAASADDAERMVLSLDIEEPPMLALFPIIAAMAGIDASKVTEANALATLQTVQAKVTSLEGEKDRLTKALSANDVEPDPTVMALAADVAVRELEGAFSPIVSAAGMTLLKTELVGNVDKAEYAPFILSAETPLHAVRSLQRIAKIIKDNPAVKKGGQTQLQNVVALSREVPDEQQAEKPPTAERLQELLNATPTGQAIVASSKK
jgi:hypothetical protein